MRYWYDTEFLEDGKTVELISIGIVAEDGREYYAVNSDAPWDRIKRHDWLMTNVVPHLPGNNPPRRLEGGNDWIWALTTRDARVKPHWVIANEVRDFLLAGEGKPELWAWYGAYDHVALCQLWGRMINKPAGVPMFTHDVKQEAVRLGDPRMPNQAGAEHDALADARHTRQMWEHLQDLDTGFVSDVHTYGQEDPVRRLVDPPVEP